MDERTFPIMRRPDDKTPATPLRIPWSVADKAYSVYSARFGRSQTLERLGERGGFWVDEMDDYHPGWREETSEIAALRQQLADTERFRAQEAQRYAFHVDEALTERDALAAKVAGLLAACATWERRFHELGAVRDAALARWRSVVIAFVAPLRSITDSDMVPANGGHTSLRNYVRHWLLPALDAFASPAEPKGRGDMTGIERIAAERQRQIAEGWTLEHDDEHVDDALAWAAVCYAAPDWVMRPSNLEADDKSVDVRLRDPWPGDWSTKWDERDRLRGTGTEGRIRALEIAGALIAAEIDRLFRRDAQI